MTTDKNDVWKKVTHVNKLNFSGQIFRVLSILLTHILIARSLNHNDLADYSWIYGLCIFPQTLFTIGFEQSYSFFFPRMIKDHETDKVYFLLKKSFQAVIFVSLFGFLFFTAIGIMALNYLNETHLIPLLTVTLVVNSFFAIAQIPIGALRGIQDFKLSVLSEQFLLPGLPFLAVIGTCIYYPTPLSIISAQGIGFIITSVIAGYYLLTNFKDQFTPFRTKPQISKSWFYFSAPIALMLTMETIFNWTILSVAGPLLSSFEVAFIAVAIRSIQMFTFLSMGIAPLMMPRLSESYYARDKEVMRTLVQNISYWLAAWSLIMGFGVAINRGLIMSFFGHDFFLSANLLLWIIPGGIIEGMGAYIKLASLSVGQNVYGFFVYFFGAIVTAFCCYFLTTKIGAAGALAAGSIGFAFINLTRMVTFFRTTKFRPFSMGNFLGLCCLLLVLTLCFIATEATLPNTSIYIRLLTSVLVGSAAFIVCFWNDRKILLGINK